MDVFSRRFPLAIKNVLKNLDDESLSRTKEASRQINGFINNERFYWVRMMNKYNRNFQDFKKTWEKVISKTPVDTIKQLVNVVHKFFTGVPTTIGARFGMYNFFFKCIIHFLG